MSILGKLISDGLGDAGQEVAEKAVSKSLRKAAKETGESALAKLGKKIPVSYTDDIVQDIAVKAPEMQKLYRGIKAETPEKLEKYIDDMFNPTIKPRTYEGSAYGEGYYFTPFRDSAESYASNDLAKPYQAVLEIEQPRNRFIGINKQNQNRPVDFAIRAEKRVGGGRAASVGERDFDNYLKKNGILGDRVNDNITVIKDNDAVKNMRVAGRKEPGKDWDYSAMLGENEIAQSLKNAENYLPNVRMSYYDGYGSRGGFANDVKAIGTKDVAPIDPETLPEGYDYYRKVTDMNKAKYGYVYDAVSKETGKPARRVTNADLRQYLEDYYPDYISGDKMTKYDMEKAIQDAIEDGLADEAWENGADISALVHSKFPRAGVRDIYNDHSGRTGKLDRELSRRLGIGESNSVMMDRLNNDTGRAAGDVSENRVGIKFDDWSSDEDKVSVMGHERLHLFQNASNRNDFNYEKVKPVYQDLHEDLKKALLNEDEIRKAHSGSDFERMGGMGYWGSDIEQEARMLEAYLYSEGYVKTRPYRLDEFASKMNIIKPAFDKFFKGLRELSKKGVALPAIAGLVGIGAMAGGQNSKNENS